MTQTHGYSRNLKIEDLPDGKEETEMSDYIWILVGFINLIL